MSWRSNVDMCVHVLVRVDVAPPEQERRPDAAQAQLGVAAGGQAALDVDAPARVVVFVSSPVDVPMLPLTMNT